MELPRKARRRRAADNGAKRRRRPDWRAIGASPELSAEHAGLVYVDDSRPGLTRRRAGRGFCYLDASGHVISDKGTLARIRSLAVPPAWKDVWICPLPNGHIQARGRDDRGRKQYRYHPRWREVRDESKFHRMLAFGAALPRIRAAVERDLALPGLPRAKVLATIVSLLERTLIRVGNDEYARDNKSFGLTTLREDHVEVTGPRLRFSFRGKSGKEHTLELHDRRLARIVGRIQSLPGQELFQYVDEAGERVSVDSSDVNAYLREAASDDFTAKDVRTWAGTVLAARYLRERPEPTSVAEAKHAVIDVVKEVARRLGNTPAVCRKSYIHPAVLEGFMARARAATKQVTEEARALALELAGEEAELLRMLERMAAPAVDAKVVGEDG